MQIQKENSMKIKKQDRGFKGVWIEKEIWLTKELTWLEKLFLTEIDSLDNENHCYASNDHFSDFFDISKSRCSQIINSLIKKGYLKAKYLYEGKEIKKRFLIVQQNKIKKSEKRELKSNREQYLVDKIGYLNNKTGYLESYEGNNIINNTSNNTILKNSISVSKETLDLPTLNNLKNIKKIGGFRNKLPKNEFILPTSLILKCNKFMKDFEKRNLSKYEWDENWLKEKNIDLNKLKNIKSPYKKASKRWAKMQQEGIWPSKKDWMTKDLDKWFYNPNSKKSWFLYCLFNRPKEVNYSKPAQANYPEEFDITIGNSFMKKHGIVKKSIEISDWYNKYEDSYFKYHTVNGGNWQGVCGTLVRFLTKYKEFIDTWENWSTGNYGMNNATWSKFEEWIKQEYGININITDKALKRTLDFYERESK